MKTKKIITLILTLSTVICSNFTSLGAQSSLDLANDTTLDLATEFQLNNDEIKNLDRNLNNAINKANVINANSTTTNTVVTVPVSENLTLTVATLEKPIITSRTSVAHTESTITSTFTLTNALGVDVLVLDAYGVFELSNTKSTPIDAYGSYDAFFFNNMTSDSTLGKSAYNAWVRIKFSGTIDIGVDPVSVTLKSFKKNCKIYCNAKGKYTATWN